MTNSDGTTSKKRGRPKGRPKRPLWTLKEMADSRILSHETELFLQLVVCFERTAPNNIHSKFERDKLALETIKKISHLLQKFERRYIQLHTQAFSIVLADEVARVYQRTVDEHLSPDTQRGLLIELFRQHRLGLDVDEREVYGVVTTATFPIEMFLRTPSQIRAKKGAAVCARDALKPLTGVGARAMEYRLKGQWPLVGLGFEALELFGTAATRKEIRDHLDRQFFVMLPAPTATEKDSSREAPSAPAAPGERAQT